MKPLVSILIPAYNAKDYIAQTLRSALAQTWPNTEIIVVNDGSTDRTLAVLSRFESHRVRVVTQQNKGGAAARNAAYALSRGEYIQWLDADDLLSPEKIATQMQALDKSCTRHTLLSSPWARFLYRPDRAKFRPSALWCDLAPTEWMLRAMEQNLFMQTATWLVSRELAEAAGPWDTTMLSDDDGEYFARVLMKSDHVRFVAGGKVFYRRTGVHSLSYIGRSNQKMEAMFRAQRLRIGYLRSLADTERAHAACVAYLQSWVCYYYPERTDILEQSRQLARELGGTLHLPPLPPKYTRLDQLLGRPRAKRLQHLVARIKFWTLRLWDRGPFHLSLFTRRPKRASDLPDRADSDAGGTDRTQTPAQDVLPLERWDQQM